VRVAKPADRWRELLAAGRTVVLDGATGSELERRGIAVDPVCWNALAALHHPEALTSVHAAHIAAGADIITTNTFASSRFVLDAAGRGVDFDAINEAAVAAAARARGGRSIGIAGSISCLPPAFDTRRYPTPARERAAYAELAAKLAELGVDLLVLEMMQDIEHASRALEAARATGLPVWIGLSCRRDVGTGDLVGFDFPATRFEDVAAALVAHEPDVVAIMHTPVTAVPFALERLRSLWRGPIGVYPELGSFDPVTQTRSRAIAPATFARLAQDWRASGATILGGCCGATPAHIAALRSRLVRSDGD
jgi:S-methylmethionine-dependent homocysteine/selenocysteine methylase